MRDAITVTKKWEDDKKAYFTVQERTTGYGLGGFHLPLSASQDRHRVIREARETAMWLFRRAEDITGVELPDGEFAK
jgi:hypothetical protein